MLNELSEKAHAKLDDFKKNKLATATAAEMLEATAAEDYLKKLDAFLSFIDEPDELDAKKVLGGGSKSK